MVMVIRPDLYPLTSAFFANCGELTLIELSSFTAKASNGPREA